jgi:subtilisin family serine protease
VDFEKAVLELATEDQDTLLEINELCKKLFGAGRQVVAAAGNDWENGKARRRRRNPPNRPLPKEPRLNAPVARYPAGFPAVVGVGALPKNSRNAQTDMYKASAYSNLGDKPTGDAIMTLGGEEGERKGLLGLYLAEEFPERSKGNNRNLIRMIRRKADQNNHWAWWAGTSFAAPILTGTLASVLSGPLHPDNTQRAIRELYRMGIIREAKTEADEDVLDVKQGP